MAKELEIKYYDSPLVLRALIDKHSEDKNFEAMERCMRLRIAANPRHETYESLSHYLKFAKRYDDWIKLWDEFLEKLPEVDFKHSKKSYEIAFHLSQRHKWKQAAPYADRAAETHSEWGLRIGGFCAEANQEWDKAETYYRKAAESYNYSSYLWYAYCARTGKGDINKARQIAFNQSYKRRAMPLGTLYYLDEEPEIALDYFIKASDEKVENFDYALWLVFIVAEELEETKKRDDALNAIIKLSEPKADQLPYNYYLPLAKWFKKDIANGRKAETDRKELDEIDKLVPRGNSPVFHYSIGKYLDLHGKSEEADEYMLESMSCPYMFDNVRSLAGQWLINKKIGPDAYAKRLHTELNLIK
ncbi:MAG: hypothetical protein ACKVH8_08515 [Pirellulales bacterium]